MRNSLEDIQRLFTTNEASFDKTAQLQQLLTQIEASLLRKEDQKVTEKTQNY